MLKLWKRILKKMKKTEDEKVAHERPKGVVSKKAKGVDEPLLDLDEVDEKKIPIVVQQLDTLFNPHRWVDIKMTVPPKRRFLVTSNNPRGSTLSFSYILEDDPSQELRVDLIVVPANNEYLFNIRFPNGESVRRTLKEGDNFQMLYDELNEYLEAILREYGEGVVVH